MKFKILHLIGDKRAGGSNIYVKRLINSHLQKKFDFYVKRFEELSPTLKPDLTVFHYPCSWKYLPKLFNLKRSSKLAILDHHYCQGFEQNQVSSLFRFRVMLRLSYGLADYVIAVSQAQRQWMINNKLCQASKIIVLSGSAPIEDFLAIPFKENKNNNVNSQPLIIGAYGRFAPQKGFDILLKAFALLNPQKFQLHLGGYGQDEEQIKTLANNLSHIKLLGKIKDVPQFLASCDAIVIPSRWESWGLVCLEAKASGKPVIASDVDGLSEQLTDCGLLVAPNSIEDLRKAIESLPKQPLTSWGEIGRNSVINSWDEFLNNWDKFLEEVSI